MDDDSCGGTCPVASFVCPASEQFTVMTAPYDSREAMSCTISSEVVTP
jgi:hypothetical protein